MAPFGFESYLRHGVSCFQTSLSLSLSLIKTHETVQLDRKVIGLSGWTHTLTISTQNDRTISILCVRMVERSNSKSCPLNHSVCVDSLLDLCSNNTVRFPHISKALAQLVNLVKEMTYKNVH